MSRTRITFAGLFGGVAIVAALASRTALYAQAPARPGAADAAVEALVTEVRALRADLAAAARSQLRAQLLLGRVQMQEQRLAYLDKQRADTAALIGIQSQLTSGLRNQTQGIDRGGCAGVPAEQRRECEATATVLKRQLAEQEQREQQMRAQESDLANALSAEQARWGAFNSQLDELERSLR